jgi:hypothetical protein
MKNEVQIYKYGELVKGLKNELIGPIGDRIIVPITGDSRHLPTFLVEAAVRGMKNSGKYDLRFVLDKKEEWLHKLQGDNPKTYEVISDIYKYVVFSKKFEGSDYNTYLRWKFKNFFM